MRYPRQTRALGCAAVIALLGACGDANAPEATPTPLVTPTPRPSIDNLLASCPTAAQVQAINSQLRLVFDADPTHALPLACTAAAGSANLTLYQKRVYQAFVAMQQITFDAPLPWTSQPLYQWLVSTIRGVHFTSASAYSWCCEPGAMIVVHAAANQATDNSCLMAGQTSRWIAPNIGCGMDAFIALVVHEARHNNGKPHTCGSSDNTIAEMGSWAVQYYLFRWFAEHTGDYLTPADGLPSPGFYRDKAHEQAQQTCSGRFCHDTCPAGFIVEGMAPSLLEDHAEWDACTE
jgi:hypothetical protein